MSIMLVIILLFAVGLLVTTGLYIYRKHYLINRFRQKYYPGLSSVPKRHKVLLILPTIMGYDGRPIKQRFLMLPGIALSVLAALTPDDWDVELVFETIEDIPYDTDADLVGISAMGMGFLRGLEMARKFQARGKKVVLGGLMATLNPHYALENGADVVCVGDAEGVWQKILCDFEEDRLEEIYEGFSTSTLQWPVPRYDLIAKKRIGMVLPVMAGRGCPHECEFCSIAAAYKGEYFRRPIDEVIRDIKAVKSLGFRRILLLDDNIAADPDHAIQLFSEMEKLNIHWVGQCALYIADQKSMLEAAVRSGCQTLSFGLETIHQGNLDSIDKTFGKVEDYEEKIQIIREAGINVAAEFMFGLDHDGPETFDQTADFIIQNRILLPKFHILTPVPGTPLYDRFERDGRIIDRDFYHYTISRAVFQPAQMSPQELEEGFWRLSDKVFTIPSIITRVIGSTARFSILYRIVFLVVNFHYRKFVRRRIATGMF